MTQTTQVGHMFCKLAAGKFKYLIKVCLFYIRNAVTLSIMQMCLLLQFSVVVSFAFSTNIILIANTLTASPASEFESQSHSGFILRPFYGDIGQISSSSYESLLMHLRPRKTGEVGGNSQDSQGGQLSSLFRSNIIYRL